MLYFIRTECGCEVLAEAPAEKPRWQAMIQLSAPPAAGLSRQLILVDTVRSSKLPLKSHHIYEYNIHLLKSNLEKCFRRRLYTETMATAKQLLFQDPAELMRCLSVILLEDSLLYPYLYNQVIWLQLAHSKGYQLTTEDAQIILDATCTGLESSTRYNLAFSRGEQLDSKIASRSSDLAFSYAQEGKNHFQSATAAARDAFIGPRLCSLSGFLGKKGRTSLLRVIAFRALKEDLPLEAEYASMDIADTEEFSPAIHMIPQAVDFQACPFLLETIPHKEAIWWHWSSTNTRPIQDHQQDIAEGADEAHRIQHEATYKNIERTLQVNARSTIDIMNRDRKKAKKINTLDCWLANAST